MPIDGNGIYSVPVGTEGVAGQPIESAKYNAFLTDLTAGMNAVRPVTLGGTGTSSVAGIRGVLGIPTTTVDNTIPRFDGTAGAMQTSGVTIGDTGNIVTTGTITAGS